MDAAMSNSQPAINLNSPVNQMQTPNMLPLMDMAGKTIPHPRAQLYYLVPVTDQAVGYAQNPNVTCSHPQVYI